MLNLSLATIALAAAIGFYAFLDDAITSTRPEPVDVWHCDGWQGKMFKTEKDMRSVFK